MSERPTGESSPGGCAGYSHTGGHWVLAAFQPRLEPYPEGRSVQVQGIHPGRELGRTAHRKPRLLLRLSGVFLLRYAERQFRAVLFQEPLRITRFAPVATGLR